MNFLGFGGGLAKGAKEIVVQGAKVAVPEVREDIAPSDMALGIRPEHIRFDDASKLRGSVYGADTPVPFTEDANADRPLAPYPASKRSMELFAYSYAHLWKLPTTVVREIVYTEPAVKGDTSSGKVLKAARINDNEEFVIMVPLFCNIGEKIEIDTRTDEYRSRAK